jgi:hypothetical protein
VPGSRSRTPSIDPAIEIPATIPHTTPVRVEPGELRTIAARPHRRKSAFGKLKVTCRFRRSHEFHGSTSVVDASCMRQVAFRLNRGTKMSENKIKK